MTTVTDDEFISKVGSFIDELPKEPVYITKHGRRVVVMLDAVEFERLISAVDNRQSYLVEELPEDAVFAFESGPQAPARPELDHLMK